MTATPRNPSYGAGKRGGGARTYRGPIAGAGSRRRRCGSLVQSTPPSPFPAVASPPSLVSPFHDQIHGVNLVGEKTGGRSLPDRDDRGWAGMLHKKTREVNGPSGNFRDSVVGRYFTLPNPKIPDISISISTI
jgi:hypothetical protein